jgi:hypothetical protein
MADDPSDAVLWHWKKMPLTDANTIKGLTTAYQRREWKHYVDGRRETEGGRRFVTGLTPCARAGPQSWLVRSGTGDSGLVRGGNCRQSGDEGFCDNAGKRSPHDYE